MSEKNGAITGGRFGTDGPKLSKRTTPQREGAKRALRAKGPRAGADGLKRWAYVGVGGTLTLSGWLNGMAFAELAPTPWHGWALGLSIPGLILVFSRVAALLWGRGAKGLAWAGAAACLSILLLSVQHCAVSIARLTGEHVALAALMALAIDAGLVVCELATVRK